MSDYNLGTASGKIEVDGKGAALGFNVAKTAAGSFFSVIDAKIKSVQQLGRRMVAVGATGAIGFGVAIKAAADFQQQMSGVQAVTNGSADDMEALRQKALQLGADTVFSAGEAANAIEELAKAGIPVKDILNGAADAAVALAAAGGVDIPTAATIAANAMNAFGLKAKEVTGIADVLAGVANTSASDVSGIGQSLQQAGAVAHLAGLDFRDTAIAIGEMADAGIQGSDAGTSLKTMLNNLIPVTTKQVNKFEELGILTQNMTEANKTLAKVTGDGPVKTFGEVEKILGKYVQSIDKGKVGTVKNATAVQQLLMQYGGLHNAFFDAKGDIKSLGGLQGELSKALKGMTRQQKLATLETLFGADAMRASAILSLEGKKGYEEFSKAVAKTKAADVAKARLDNLAGSVEQFKGSLQTAEITIGSIFLPILTKIFNAGTKLLNFFNALPKPIQITIGVLAAIGSAGLIVVGMLLAMAPVILSVVANFFLMRGLGFVIGFFRALITSAAAGTLSLESISVAAKTAGASFLKMGKRGVLAGKLLLVFTRAIYAIGLAMKFAMTNPYVLAFIALVAIGILLYKKWKPFHDLVNKIAASMVKGFKAAWNAVKPLFSKGLELLQKFGNYLSSTLGPVIKNFYNTIVKALVAQWVKLQKAIQKNLLPALQELKKTFDTDLKPALQDTAKFLGPIISGIGHGLAAAFSFLGKVLKPVAVFLIEVLIPALISLYAKYLVFLIKEFGNLLVGVIKVITGIINVISGFIKIFKGIFTGDWSLALQGAQQVLRGFFTIITAMFWAGIKLPLKIVKGFVKRLFANFSLMGAIKGIVRGVFTAISAIIKLELAIAKALVSAAWNGIKSLTAKAWAGIRAAVRNGIDLVIGVLKGLKERFLDPITNLQQAMYDAGVSLLQKLAEGAWSMVEKATAPFKDAAGKIKGLFGGSPVEWGPLISFNQGHAGRELMKFLSEGIEKETARTVRSAEKAANAISDTLGKSMVSRGGAFTVMAGSTGTHAATHLATPGQRTRLRPKAAKKTTLRLVSGRLAFDRSGRAFIRGVAQEVVDNNEAYNARGNRTKKGNAK